MLEGTKLTDNLVSQNGNKKLHQEGITKSLGEMNLKYRNRNKLLQTA